jgi:hypothetical protein
VQEPGQLGVLAQAVAVAPDVDDVAVVAQNIASWNQLLPWLRRVDTLRGGQALSG